MLVVAFALVVALVVALIVVPRIAGAVPLTVLSGSMRPAFGAGAVVVVRPTDASDLRVGDVVTYQLRSGDPTLVTHRIVGMTVGAHETTFRTRGDANGVDDPEPVRDVQIKGRVWYHLPLVGHLTGKLDGAQRGLVVRAVATGMLLWAAWLISGSLRDKVARQRQQRSTT